MQCTTEHNRHQAGGPYASVTSVDIFAFRLFCIACLIEQPSDKLPLHTDSHANQVAQQAVYSSKHRRDTNALWYMESGEVGVYARTWLGAWVVHAVLLIFGASRCRGLGRIRREYLLLGERHNVTVAIHDSMHCRLPNTE